MPEYIYKGRRISSTQELTPEQVELYGRAMLSRESVQQGLQAGKTDKDMQSQLSALSESGLALRQAGGSTPGGTKPKMDYLANKAAYGPTIALAAPKTGTTTPGINAPLNTPAGGPVTDTSGATTPGINAPLNAPAGGPIVNAPGTSGKVNLPPINVEDPNAYQQVTGALQQQSQNVQDFDQNYQPSEDLDTYIERRVGEITEQLEQARLSGQTNIEQARLGIGAQGNIAANELEQQYSMQSQDILRQTDKLRQEYNTGRRNIEAEQAEKLPEYQSQKSQADVQAAKAAKNIIDYMAKRGLARGGQAVSEIAGVEGQRLGMHQTADIGQQRYMRDVSGRVAGLEEQRAGGLADIERMQGMALQNLNIGQRNIIQQTQSLLQGLDVEEKNYLNQLASMRLEMEKGLSQEYKNMSEDEKDRAFSRILQQAGFASDNLAMMLNVIRQISDAKNVVWQQNFTERQFTEGVRQFDTGQEFGERQFEEGVRQFGVGQEFGERQFEEDIRQFNTGQTQPTQSDQYTPTQYANYNEVRTKMLNQYSSDPGEALRYIQKMGKDTYIKLMGEQLYKQLVKDVEAAAKSGIGAGDINAVLDDLKGMSPEDAYMELADNAAEYIQYLGLERYNKLLSSFKSPL